tara:strand:- start:472 stop:1332 length:861 start_codon:yes stop_codon:yes gene_type:complete
MKKYFVIGNPIEHSLSPKLHNYWIKKNHIHAVYEKKLLKEKELELICNKVREGKIDGFNVTVPFKEKIIKYIDVLSEDAFNSKAVNTVYKQSKNGENKLIGDNTDIYGFKKSLPILFRAGRGGRCGAIILGAGGASRAIIIALSHLGIDTFAIINRTKDKAIKLMQEIDPENYDPDLIYNWCEDEDKMIMIKPKIIVNCTSLGLKKNDKIPLDFSKYKKKIFSKNVIFYDLIYNPVETDFLKKAREVGQEAINGKMMFIYQAQQSFKLWHNVLPDVNQEVIDLLND